VSADVRFRMPTCGCLGALDLADDAGSTTRVYPCIRTPGHGGPHACYYFGYADLRELTPAERAAHARST